LSASCHRGQGDAFCPFWKFIVAAGRFSGFTNE
jgi:hypothetical protein